MRKIFAVICSLMLAVSLVLSGCGQKGGNAAAPAGSSVTAAGTASVPAYSAKHFIAINGNKPTFTWPTLTKKYFKNNHTMTRYTESGRLSRTVGRRQNTIL